MKILLLKTWLTNIGNGFIDKGAKVSLKKAFPEAEIIEFSGYSAITTARRAKGELGNIQQMVGKGSPLNTARLESYFSKTVQLSELVDADIAVLPGCVLYKFALEAYIPIIKQLNDRNIPLIILGGGGGDYSSSTQKYISDRTAELNIPSLITRDSTAYEFYNSNFEFAYDGIDCAFFIHDWHTPPSTSQEFVTATFDGVEEPNWETDVPIIRPNHNPFEKPHEGIIKNLGWKFKNKDLFEKENTFLSDSIEDYLFLYANTLATRSNRIHACVPTLAYGNKAKFEFQTPRAKLFDRAIQSNKDIFTEMIELDSDHISMEKDKQVNAIQKAINTALSTK